MAGPFKMKGSPMARNFGVGSPMLKKSETNQEELTKLIDKRTKLKENETKLNQRKKDGKKTFLGNLRRKRNQNKQEKNQGKINANPKAQENLKNSTRAIPKPNQHPPKLFPHKHLPKFFTERK